MQLYVRNISNLTDARFFAAYPTHYFGFCFDALNENAVTIEKAKEIIAWLHEPKIVGQFANYQSIEEILFVHEQLQFDAVEVDYAYIDEAQIGTHTFINLNDITTIDELLNDDLDYIVSNISNANKYTNCFFVDDWTQEKLEQAINQQVKGIVINCSKEEKAGISSVDIYADWLDIIEDYLE